MEQAKPVEDQFSKLHPCLPVNTSIGIIGAGPSGISAAYALIKLGYNNITILEKHHTVAGMCESIEIQGKVYDLGGQVLAANSAPVIFHLAKEIGAELEEMDSHKLALIDSSTGKYRNIKVTDDYVSVIALTDLAADLTPTYLEAHGFKSVPQSVAYGYTASGYGFSQDMPYAYIHEFTRTSMAGKIRRFRGGYTSFWEKISKHLRVKVLCNTEVLTVKRNDNAVGVSINVKNIKGESEVMEFDKIIISGAFPFKNGKAYRSPVSNHTGLSNSLDFGRKFLSQKRLIPGSFVSENETQVMDLNDVEKELFSKVITIDYYTTVLKIKGLENMPVGFYYFGQYMDDPATIGHPVAMQRFYADSNIFLFWSYGNSLDIQGPTVRELAIKVVETMGGQIEQLVLQRRFKYFPHVSSQDMKNGFYERLESELQGKRDTYYVGGLMAFELTERNASYSMALICKHFANNNSSPVFPYVKSLFPLQSYNGDKNLNGLGEHPGVEFPDLTTLNGYLKHWGTHEGTRSKTLYTWINEEGAAVCTRTYAELNANVSFITHKILTSEKPVIKPGDRVLLVYVPGLDFVDAFFGCLRAKVLPVPVLPPDPMQRGGQALLKIENISKSCGAVAILSTIVYHSAVRAGFVKQMISLTGKNGKSSAKWPNLTWLHTDSWTKNFKKAIPDAIVDPSEPIPSDLCFLQFTSGSTGDAKGVMISHGGLVHNWWISSTVFPMTFIRNPLLWLQTMSKYKATHSAGPNFAFELVVRRLESDKDKAWNYDLSSLIFLMIAAEPVRQRTLKRFIELTYPFGLSQGVMAPGYGLAENCVFVSCAYGEGKPILVDWQGRVCCGYTDLDNQDVDIKIVDPETSVELEEAGKEGEIWISSPSAGIGYWGREEHSQQTFRNELKNHAGKKKDIYSADVEKTVESSSEFLRPEVRDGKPVKKEVIEQIKTRVAEEHGVSVAAIKLIKPKTISKTTSGKIKRFECLKQFSVPVGAVDIFTANCIADLANFSENLLVKSEPGLMTASSFHPEPDLDYDEPLVEISIHRQVGIWSLQFMAYHCVYLVELNYVLVHDVSIWSVDFVKWWALYKVQQIASNVLAQHLRGTLFLNYWFGMLGARIQSSVTLDTIYITDPSLVSIGDGAVISEGALIQSHEVKNGSDPKGKCLAEEAEVLPLQRIDGSTSVNTSTKINSVQKSTVMSYAIPDKTMSQFMGIYLVGFLSSFSGAIVYYLYIWLSEKSSLQHFAFVCIAGALHWIPFTVIAYVTMFASITWNPASFAISLAVGYLAHGLILSFLTCALTHVLTDRQQSKQSYFRYSSDTELLLLATLDLPSFSLEQKLLQYLRFLGAKVGQHCSIRAINPVSDPELVTSVPAVGSQSLVLPGSRVESDVILGALSVAPANSLLQSDRRIPRSQDFHPGKSYRVLVRHSNSLSADDDARLDARGAAAMHSMLEPLPISHHGLCAVFCKREHVKRVHISETQWGRKVREIKLRPSDESISEDSGKVEPTGILPPETGAIPRVKSGGVRYIFQLQIRPVPTDEAARDDALDCTKPWDETEFPYINLPRPLRVLLSIMAALIYEICQRLRNKEPLPEAWRIFLEQSDVKVDLSGCPMAATLEKKDTGTVTLETNWSQTSWSIFVQPLLQTVLPYFLLGLAIFAPLTGALHMKETKKIPPHWLLPFFWVSSGIAAALTCVVAKWVLVGKKKEGSDVEPEQGAYVDSMGAFLNPEMVEIERGGCIGRDALLFGHIYEGEGGKVKFGKIKIGEGGFIGSRAVAMPGVRVESGGNLAALTLAMKEEIVK
ncbi:Cell differentiation, Rcd1-like protein isoform 1 [Hibiscus syriacus]|uniref:Cell differentiation, Rcd1-like protein isoform 1 n=1 Tax=Hibiscus syriacus TaxID=106335 RepID=A0A6A3CWB5_HIBSY|nr:Cell differentiation, Rcd1-like protein isoform 1 [Hibiscus syriacus]